jgi:gp16 family phage-associated protein
MKLRTPQEAKEELERKGVSVSAWAVANGFNPNLVIMILSGQRKPLRGQSHNIAVKLGIKAGETCTDPANALAA